LFDKCIGKWAEEFAFLVRSTFAVLQSIFNPLLTSDEMSDSNLSMDLQLSLGWEEVERLVDALQDYSRFSQSRNLRLVHRIKSLWTALQSLKHEISETDGAFYAENPSMKQRLARLTKYGDIAGRIRQCIYKDELKHDRYLDIDLIILTTEIGDILELRKKEAGLTSRLRERISPDSMLLDKNNLRNQTKYQSEIDGLGTLSCC
jgi:hypothetical protein